MTTTNLQTQSNGVKFAAVLKADSVQQQFRNALGEHKDAFVASLIDLYNGDKSLQSCSTNALVCEALKAAVMKLPLNKALGYAYIIVFNNNVRQADGTFKKVPTPTFVPGYRGYIQLAMRTGKYRTINADVVYEGELRQVNKLTGDIRLDGEKKSDKIVGYFCYFELIGGFSKTLYVSVEDMAKYAKRYSPSIKRDTTVDALISKANDGKVSKVVGWEGNFNDMALKTVIRRLLGKYGYLSVEMQDSVAADNMVESAAANRAELIEDTATETIHLDEAQYEEVDTETGEIISSSAQSSTQAPADVVADGPDF